MDESYVPVFFAVWCAAAVLTWPPTIWWRVRQMRAKGLPIVPKRPADALYMENSASGRAEGWQSIGGGSNCLFIAVTPTELWVTARFPFNFIAGFWGMEHRVPKAQVLEAEVKRGLFVNTRLALRESNGRLRGMQLKLRDPEAFLAALRAC